VKVKRQLTYEMNFTNFCSSNS